MRATILPTVIGFVLVSSLGIAQDPPGTIVIRPKGSPAPAARPPAPEREGYIVIRPQVPGGTPAPTRAMPTTPRQLDGDKPTVPATTKPPIEPIPAAIPDTPAKPAPGAAPAPEADTDAAKTVLETWDAAYLKGAKIGYFHVLVREYTKDGKKYLYATKEFKMTVARFGQPVEQWTEDATLETPEGTVLTVRMRQGLSKQQVLAITGTVENGQLTVKGEGPAATAESIPWPEGVIGVAREATIYRDKNPKVGESFDYSVYDGRLNRVLKTTVRAKALENVALIQGQPAKPMLRLEAETEALRDKEGKILFRMPPGTVWCDPETMEPIRLDQDVAALGGRISYMRTVKEIAMRPPQKLVELFDTQSIKLNETVANIHDRAGVVYRFTMEKEPEPESAIPSDTRQTLKNLDKTAKTFELEVIAERSPTNAPAGAKADPGAEYLSNSYFVDWQDDRVRAHAKAAIAALPATATVWQKSQAIEKWLQQNMRSIEFSQAQSSCSEVARTLSGDCTEFGILGCGMCRALDIPSRTVYGLIYATDRSGAAFLAYHMWFEVYTDGQWLALDGTLGRGSVGPGHIKITTASWANEKSLAPVLPLIRVLMAQPKVQVLKATP